MTLEKKYDSQYEPRDWLKDNSLRHKMCHYCGDKSPAIDEFYCSVECRKKDTELGFDL